MNSYEILQQIQGLSTLAKKTKKQKSSDSISFDSAWNSLHTTIFQDIAEKRPELEAEKLETLLKQIKDNFYDTTQKSVEMILLPICKLAHIYEQNGDPKEHANRLGTVFATPEDALNYVCMVAKQDKRQTTANRTIQAIHDSCLFTLPLQFDFKKDNKIKKLIKDHMQDPEFRNLLPNLPEIEKLAAPEKARTRVSNNDKIVNEKRELVKAIIKDYKTIKNKLNKQEQITPAEQDKYNQYGNQLLSAQLELVKASLDSGRTLYDLDIYELKAYNAQYKSQTEFTLKYFLDHELTAKNYADFVNLHKIDDDSKIPPVTINGADVGYPGYYLRRLNVQTADDAAMAACLGKLSDCCQSLSGEAGEPCAIHGLTSSEGGFYVVCKGDINNTSINDALVCQSWVWRSKSDALVIDSIEAKKQFNHIANDYENSDTDTDGDSFFEETFEEEHERNNIITVDIAKAFYYELAYKLVQEHNITQVSCGITSGLSSLIVEPSIFNGSYEFPKDYNRYRDSDDQCMMCDQYSLYLLPGKEDIFFKDCKQLGIAANNVIFIKMLSFAIYNNRQDLIDKYCDLFKANNVGAKTLAILKDYLTTADLEAAITKLKQHPYLSHAIAENGGTILHYLATEKPELLRELMQIFPTKQDALLAIKQKNIDGNNLLHLTVADPELLKTLLQIFPTKQAALLAIEAKNKNNDSVLYQAMIKDKESLQELFTFYPMEDRLKVMQSTEHGYRSLLSFSATFSSDLLISLLELLPKHDRLTAIITPDQEQKNGLYQLYSSVFIHRTHSIKQILGLLPETDRVKLIMAQNTKKTTILDGVLAAPADLFQQLLDILPEPDRLRLEAEYPSKSTTPKKSVMFSTYNKGTLANVANPRNLGTRRNS